MLLSAVSFLVVAQSSSEVPEGLMNNPVFLKIQRYEFCYFAERVTDLSKACTVFNPSRKIDVDFYVLFTVYPCKIL